MKSPLNRLCLVAVMLGLASSALAACQALAGIEDRTYADGGTGPSPECVDYCKLAKTVCQGKSTLYSSDETCLATCALMPPGERGEPTAHNTVACRLNQLVLAQQTGESSTIPDYCAKAGPGGNGQCGSNCESYCQLYDAACHTDQPQLTSAQYDPATCAEKCKGLADTGSFDATADLAGDTLQCRLAHTSAASVNPTEHCSHAQLQAQTQTMPAGPCIDDPATVPDCNSYCQLEFSECQGAAQVYESLEQCHQVCGALPAGAITDTKENSVGCRKYHSYNALVDPVTHCPHTGPGGDGHCGSNAEPGAVTPTGNCVSYCILLAQACSKAIPGLAASDSFESKFKSRAACTQECDMLVGAGPNSGYSLDPLPEGNTLQCRLLHVSRALSTPLADCPAALGGTPCN